MRRFHRIAKRRTAKHIFHASQTHKVSQIRTAGGKLLYINFTNRKMDLAAQKSAETGHVYFFTRSDRSGFSHNYYLEYQLWPASGQRPTKVGTSKLIAENGWMIDDYWALTDFTQGVSGGFLAS